METRQGMNEKTGQAVFKGTVLSVQRRAHASCSGGCGQMVTATATGNMLPVAATSQAGSSHAQLYHAFISYTVISDPEEYTSGMERSSSINARLSFIADTVNQHHQMLAACFHQEFLSFQPSDTITLPSQPTLMLSNNNNSSSTFQNF